MIGQEVEVTVREDESDRKRAPLIRRHQSVYRVLRCRDPEREEREVQAVIDAMESDGYELQNFVAKDWDDGRLPGAGSAPIRRVELLFRRSLPIDEEDYMDLLNRQLGLGLTKEKVSVTEVLKTIIDRQEKQAREAES